MIDLHIHTIHSDGTDNVIKILEKAQNLSLEAISITDHDNIKAYDDLSKIDSKKYYSGIIIPGVEIKTTFNKVPIEILAYNVDMDKFSKSNCINENSHNINQNKYLENYIKVGEKLGLKCNKNISIDDNKSFAAITYYNEISKHKENYSIIPELLNEKKESFYRLTSSNINSPFYIDESNDSIDINLVIETIHNCGGKAFLAHLFAYKVDNHIFFLEEIINNTKIDGIECYYSTFTKEQTKTIIEIANKHNKYKSGGTDYHGTNKKSISLGIGEGNLEIPFEIIKDWYTI